MTAAPTPARRSSTLRRRLRTAWRTLVLAEIPTVEIFGLLERVLISERARPEIFTTVSMLDVLSLIHI